MGVRDALKHLIDVTGGRHLAAPFAKSPVEREKREKLC